MNYTVAKTTDGFGAQYQKTIQTYIYCKMHNLNFLYRPFTQVEHNYDNDTNYNTKLEKLINLIDNIKNIEEEHNITELNYNIIIRHYFETNIDLCCESEHIQFIKDCFWENKTRDYFNNNKFNVAVHIRRENYVDQGLAGERATTPNIYYLNIMNLIRQKHKEKDILFHIYSQGNSKDFFDLESDDVYFYLNDDIVETFKGFVAADSLIISPSSFSYVAALISDGEVYYKNFWHNPRKNWVIMK